MWTKTVGKVVFEARRLHDPDHPEASSWEAVVDPNAHPDDQETGDDAIRGDTLEECFQNAFDAERAAQEDDNPVMDDIVIAAVQITYYGAGNNEYLEAKKNAKAVEDVDHEDVDDEDEE
jgi:hypothetical protein